MGLAVNVSLVQMTDGVEDNRPSIEMKCLRSNMVSVSFVSLIYHSRTDQRLLIIVTFQGFPERFYVQAVTHGWLLLTMMNG